MELVAKNAVKFGNNKVEQFELTVPYAHTWIAENSALDVSKRWAWAAALSDDVNKMGSLVRLLRKVICPRLSLCASIYGESVTSSTSLSLITLLHWCASPMMVEMR